MDLQVIRKHGVARQISNQPETRRSDHHGNDGQTVETVGQIHRVASGHDDEAAEDDEEPAEIDHQIRAQPEDSTARGQYQIRSLTSVERTLRRALSGELAILTRAATFLGTTAAVAPFVGLFGTVWGIMRAFEDIGRSGSTSLVAVAPGIAEALINTAAGLGAAIPALMGYNFLAGRFKHLRHQMEDFTLEFLNLTERNFT